MASNSQRSSHLCIPSSGVKDVRHHAWPMTLLRHASLCLIPSSADTGNVTREHPAPSQVHMHRLRLLLQDYRDLLISSIKTRAQHVPQHSCGWLTRKEVPPASTSQPAALSARCLPVLSLIMSIAALFKLLSGRQVTFQRPLNMHMSLSAYFCIASTWLTLCGLLPSSSMCFHVLPSHNALLPKSSE